MNEKLQKYFLPFLRHDQILTSEIDLNLYSYDAAMDRALPQAVLFPETAQEVSKILRVCDQHNIPFVARGAGTNLCGGVIPLQGAVVVAPTRMKKIHSFDAQKRTIVVEPGLPNLFLKKYLEPYGLYYAPDPASQKACTIGGNLGTNAGGPHCLKYGVTANHVLGLEVVLPNGEIVEFSGAQKGADFTSLMVGSEGTLGIVTKAKLQLLSIPKFVETMLVAFPSMDWAMKTVSDIIANAIVPACLEAMDQLTVNAIEKFVKAGYPINAGAVLIIELDGQKNLTDQIQKVRAICEKNKAMEVRLAKDHFERNKLWEGRRGAYPSLAQLAPNVLVEDGVVPRNRLVEAAKKVREIAEEYRVEVSLIFHAGDGNLHPQILFDERDVELTERVKKAGMMMLKACVDLGGSISGEHGIGIDKREAMAWLFSPETLLFFRKLKLMFDPKNLANPDKIIPLVLQKPNRKPLQKTDVLIDHDLENFTVSVGAGMKLSRLHEILEQKNHKVFLPNVDQSIGAWIATHAASKDRAGDQVIEMDIVLPNGDSIHLGAKVMKNVAGYNALRLFFDSRGELGEIVNVTLRTFAAEYNFDFETVEDTAETSEAVKKLNDQLKQILSS